LFGGENKIEWTAFVNAMNVNLRITWQVICGFISSIIFEGKSSVWRCLLLCDVFDILTIY
jgi:hypothetical protein